MNLPDRECDCDCECESMDPEGVAGELVALVAHGDGGSSIAIVTRLCVSVELRVSTCRAVWALVRRL